MNPIHTIFLGAAILVSLCGCEQSSTTSSSGFSLSVQEVATDSDVRAAVVLIRSASPGSISVDEDGGHNSITLQEVGGFYEGSVALVANRIVPSVEGNLYIQILTRPQTPGGSYAGGPSTHILPRTTQLDDYFSITAISGDYSLNTPIEIARQRGKPVTLTVGRPTK